MQATGSCWFARRCRGLPVPCRPWRDDAHATDIDDLNSILERHRQLALDLGVEAEDLIVQAGRDIRQALRSLLDAKTASERYAAIATLLPIGEWLSTHIGERFLAQKGEVEWVDARSALTTLAESNPGGRRAWLSARCESRADGQLQQDWLTRKRALITAGFVASHHAGGTALLGRGGSDTSAALLAARLEAQHLEIWTDVNGLFSADPRLIPTARLLKELDYDEALEMAASGAKVVHSRCIRAASDADMPILIRDLARPAIQGTQIRAIGVSWQANQPAQPREGIRSICYRADMAVLLLQNLDTREQVGFLAWVFSCIAGAGISIDLVATSETTTTVALNRTSNVLDDRLLETLAEQLRARCAVTVYPHCIGINLVGRGARLALAKLDPGSEFFAECRLLMLSQSANDLCTSIVIPATDAQTLLENLHTSLIGRGLDADQFAVVFGPAWQELRA